MKSENLYPIWGILYILCAGLGFIPEPAGGVQVFLTSLSLLFFLPPAWILYNAKISGRHRDAQIVTLLSAASLTVTLLLLILSIRTAIRSEAVGFFFHTMLTILSAPMLCSGYWALSLFGWACLLVAGLGILKKKV